MIFEYIVERLFGWLSGLKNEYEKNCKSLIFVCIKMKKIVQKWDCEWKYTCICHENLRMFLIWRLPRMKVS